MNDKQRVLVIDDDNDILEMVSRALTLEGYDVATANSGEGGLALLTSHNPDMVLLDVVMPGLDGFEVLGIIRQRSSVPVIMLTGRKDKGVLSETLSLGADDYITKPFGLHELIARIRAKLRRTQRNSRS